MPTHKSPRERLIDEGYVPGQLVSRNMGRRLLWVGVVGVAVVGALVLIDGRGEHWVPFAALVGSAAAIVAVLVRWHSARPDIVFEDTGLRIDGELYEWAHVERLELTGSGVTVVIGRAGEGSRRHIAVRATDPRGKQR
ncbi:MAG: hypothetical protein M3Q72_10545 [Actinomycetota bacterium]|nr:hypothetical protein [Myxococcota bacterium]MDQ3177964.1 hypothetical protein [Actinomycetota bacterium]